MLALWRCSSGAPCDSRRVAMWWPCSRRDTCWAVQEEVGVPVTCGQAALAPAAHAGFELLGSARRTDSGLVFRLTRNRELVARFAVLAGNRVLSHGRISG